MTNRIISLVLLFTIFHRANCQVVQVQKLKPVAETNLSTQKFLATIKLIDAALNSINSINSLIKKENYRNKISSLNNPATSDIGFNLETEIISALKPLLDKARGTDTKKFSEIITSLVYNPLKTQGIKSVFNISNLLNSLLTMVGDLAITEKKITRADLDNFIQSISKYFMQYEKLKEANLSFNEEVNKFNLKLQDLQFDTREFIYDMVTVLYGITDRQTLKQKSLEEILLKYLDKDLVDTMFKRKTAATLTEIHYPADAIKSAKEIVYGIQKLFNEYQKIYLDNYSEVRAVLLQSKELGRNINLKQVEQSVTEFDQLYNESREADVLNLRLNTLYERLKYLVSIDNMK